MKFAYALHASQDYSSNAHGEERLWKHIWPINVPPKIKCFLWRACHEAIGVCHELNKRIQNINPECHLCKSSMETVLHCLIQCPVANFDMAPYSPHFLSQPMNIQSFKEWVTHWLSVPGYTKESRRQIFSNLPSTCWLIWLNRNAMLFNRIPFNIHSVSWLFNSFCRDLDWS